MVPGTTGSPCPDATRTAQLEAEYRELREDERQWSGRSVSLGSFYLVVVGSTAFYLLQNETPTKIAHEAAIGFAAPIPAFGISAIIIRQAITATIRSRLLLAYERALAQARQGTSTHVVTLASGALIPLGSSFHGQRPWLQGGIGGLLAWVERVGFFMVAGICYLSIHALAKPSLQVAAGIVDGVFALILISQSVNGIPWKGFDRLERKIARAAREVIGPSQPGWTERLTTWIAHHLSQ